jgi:hypothetical protein
MCSTIPGSDPAIDVGLGVFRHRFGGRTVWVHTGFWSTVALHVPESDVTIAVATNQTSTHLPAGAMSRLWARLIELTASPS